MSQASIVEQSSQTARATARLALIGAFLIVLAFVAERALFQVEHVKASERMIDVRGAADAIELIDERLTMSANMMAATGEQRWIERYETNIPLMDQAIARAAERAPAALSKRFEADTTGANDRLVALERQSFALAAAGQTQSARALLDGQNYQQGKQVLVDGTAALVSGMMAIATADLDALSRRSALFITLMLSLSFIGLTLLSRRLNASLSKAETAYLDSEAHLQRLAMSDFLTGLPNRMALREQFQKALTKAQASGGTIDVMMIDLDRFKPINDLHGHLRGDTVLKTIAQRIREFTDADDICARFGGDEFVIIRTLPRSQDDAQNRSQDYSTRLIEMLSRPIITEGQTSQVGASVGIASFPADAREGDALLRCADIALYRAKQSGRSATRIYHVDMETGSEQRLAAEEEIRNAIADGQIIPYFQPIVDVASRRVCGLEALARWHHPSRGIIAPVDFMPLAEASGELANLTLSVLRQACTNARDWPADITVAVNVSPEQIQDEWLSTKILKVLTETGFPPHRLEIELTETALVTDFTSAKRVIQSLKNLGIRVALDDFGTGYSSLFYLSELHFDKIKIDRSFVRTLHDRTESATIINAIIGLGRSLGIPTMAEGVETERDAEVLRNLGCLTAQGYLYSQPLPADQIPQLFEPAAKPLQTATAA